MPGIDGAKMPRRFVHRNPDGGLPDDPMGTIDCGRGGGSGLGRSSIFGGRAMAATNLRDPSARALLAVLLAALLHPTGEARGQGFRDAIRYEGAVVCLDRDGKILSWDAASGEFQPDLS